MRAVTVYVDLLFLLNWGMNCWVLWGTGVLLQQRTRMMPLFLAAAGGSVCALLWLLVPLGLIPELVLKCLTAVAVVQLCFTPAKVRDLVKLTVAFLGLSALCAGITYALALSGTAKTGEPLPSVAWWLLLGGPMLMTLPLRRIWAVLHARLGSLQHASQLRLTLCGQVFEICATLDTGNTLHEPLTARPVIIINPAVLSNALSERCVAAMVSWQGGTNDQGLLDSFADASLITKLVFIPYTTVAESGLMLGIRPDKCEIFGQSGWLEVKAVLGVSRTEVDLAGYSALLPRSILSVEL